MPRIAETLVEILALLLDFCPGKSFWLVLLEGLISSTEYSVTTENPRIKTSHVVFLIKLCAKLLAVLYYTHSKPLP